MAELLICVILEISRDFEWGTFELHRLQSLEFLAFHHFRSQLFAVQWMLQPVFPVCLHLLICALWKRSLHSPVLFFELFILFKLALELLDTRHRRLYHDKTKAIIKII